jgi:LuxR family maltose regulon positive regulatory protein
LLDEVSDRRVIWVCAPAGYGKTTAVASWLEHRGARAVWYHCDDGDADIASFLHFLSMTVASASDRESSPLLPLTPDLYPALSTFVRNYFREYFARLEPPAWLVLDGFEDVPAAAALRELLPVIIAEIPRGVGLLIVSREEPGPNMSRWRESDQMAMLGAAELRFDEEETSSLIRRYEQATRRRSPYDAAELHALTQGWAAGVIAMLRAENARALESVANLPRAAQAVFDYLSAEVLDRCDAATQELLLKTACLEFVTVPVAAVITGNAAVSDALQALVRTNAFVAYKPASQAFYYHPLFRGLLQARFNTRFDANERQRILAIAAQAAAEHGDVESAIDMLVLARSWDAARSWILKLAPVLMQQGRLKTLIDIITRLPDEVVRGCGWLQCWHGLAQWAFEQSAAFDILEQAFRQFERAEDELGQMLAASALAQWHGYSYVDFAPMVPWVRVLDRLLGRSPRFPTPELELQILSGLLNAAGHALPGLERLRACADRIAELVPLCADPVSRCAGLAALLHFFAMCGKTAQFRAIIPALEEIQRRPELGPTTRITLNWIHAYHHLCCGDAVETHRLLQEALGLARLHGLSAFELRIRLSELQSDEELSPQNWARQFDELAWGIAQAPLMLRGHAQYLRATYELEMGRLGEAERLAGMARATMERSHWTLAQAMTLALAAEVDSRLGRYDEADAALRACERCFAAFDIPILAFNAALVEADLESRRGGAALERMLRRALGIGREHGYAATYFRRASLLRRMVALALAHGIEPEYCRWVIRKRKWRPDADAGEGWPWPVRIRTLGAFEVFVEDERLTSGRKSQHKPLELLKCITSHRGGANADRLIEQLWPNLDGDAARNAFDLALHRLRKLLKSADNVVLSGRRVRLNPERVWVDAYALEACAEAPPHAGPRAPATLESVLRLYRGPFLADEDEPWLFAPRARIRSRFLRLVGELGSQWQSRQRWDQAVELYGQVLELEPAAEVIHRDLIRCLLSAGRAAEALTAYQRCEQSLARLLGTRPSSLTRALYAQLVSS